MPTAAVRAGLVVLGLVWALGAQAVLANDLGSYVKEGSKAAGLDACVEPTDYMRRNHMELIKHQRDVTVHMNCFGCHASVPRGGVVSEAAMAAHQAAGAAVTRMQAQMQGSVAGQGVEQ